MYNRSKILAIAVLICLPIGLLSLPQSQEIIGEISQEPAKFIISGWSFPDEHGQGIDTLTIYENSTGAWLAILGGFSPTVGHTGTTNFDWTAGLGIKIRVDCWLNSTLANVASTAEGKNVIRHNVIVVLDNGTEIVNQANFTYVAAGALGAMYEYYYDVVLNFLPQSGQIYTATITYEVYY